MSLVGKPAPDFTLINTGKTPVALSSLRGKKVILAFYPAAFSGICDKEMCIFQDRLAALNDANATVLGVSPDSPFANAKFAEIHGLSFELLSDLHADQGAVFWTNLPPTERGSDRPPPAGWRARIDARCTYVVSVRCKSWLERHHYDVSGVVAAWQERGLTPSARSMKVGAGKPRCFKFDNELVDVLLNELRAGVAVECPGRRLYRAVEHADESSSGVCVDGIPVLVQLDDVDAVQVLGLDVVPQ